MSDSPTFAIDTNMVQLMINELQQSKISDKNGFYMQSVIDRLDHCNQVYLHEYETQLQNLVDELDKGEFNPADFRRFAKASARMTSKIYTQFLNTIRVIYSNGE